MDTLIAQSGSSGLPLILSIVAVLVTVGGFLLNAQRARVDVRKGNAESASIELELLTDLRREMSGLRDRLLDAESNAADARAELAREIAKASKERHDLKDDIYVRDGRIAQLKERVDELEALVASLRAQLDEQRYGRRIDDGAGT